MKYNLELIFETMPNLSLGIYVVRLLIIKLPSKYSKYRKM